MGPRLLAVASLVLAVPLSAIAAVNTGLPGLLVCWGGIVAVNAVHAAGSPLSRALGRDTPRKDDDWD